MDAQHFEKTHCLHFHEEEKEERKKKKCSNISRLENEDIVFLRKVGNRLPVMQRGGGGEEEEEEEEETECTNQPEQRTKKGRSSDSWATGKATGQQVTHLSV
jgi:hypothetical protein